MLTCQEPTTAEASNTSLLRTGGRLSQQTQLLRTAVRGESDVSSNALASEGVFVSTYYIKFFDLFGQVKYD